MNQLEVTFVLGWLLGVLVGLSLGFHLGHLYEKHFMPWIATKVKQWLVK